MYVDWNKVLKMNISCSISFSEISKFDNGHLPTVYSQLFQFKKISLKEFTLIKKLWEDDNYECRTSVEELIHWFFDYSDKHARNSVSFSLKKLEKYGILNYSKINFKTYYLKLSSLIFIRLRNYLNRKLVGVDWKNTLYLKMDGEEMLEIERIPICGIRESITNLRVPILTNSNYDKRKINFNAKKYEGLSESEKKQLERLSAFGQSYVDAKLKQIKRGSIGRFSNEELECINEFVPYYENLICSITGKVSYSLLDNIRNKKMSKLWKPIWNTFSLCKEKGYDWRIYLDAQFDSFKNWNKTNLKFPMPNMLYSERALVAYDNYIYHNQTAYQNEGWNKKLKAKNVGKYSEEVRKKLETDISQIEIKIKFTYKKQNNVDFKNIDRKISNINNLYWSKAIQDMWFDLSNEFLSMVPNSKNDLKTMKNRFDSWDAKLECFDELVNNRAKMEVIKEVWDELSIPNIYGLLDTNNQMKLAISK